jgi:hypothetical protein
MAGIGGTAATLAKHEGLTSRSEDLSPAAGNPARNLPRPRFQDSPRSGSSVRAAAFNAAS